MKIHIISFLALGGVAVTTSLVPTSAHALILFDPSNSTNIRKVKNFWLDATFTPVRSSTEILGFNEAQKVTLINP